MELERNHLSINTGTSIVKRKILTTYIEQIGMDKVLPMITVRFKVVAAVVGAVM